VKNVEQSLCAKCNGIGKISKPASVEEQERHWTVKQLSCKAYLFIRNASAAKGAVTADQSHLLLTGEYSLNCQVFLIAWRYSWKPFYEMLVSRCFQEESYSNTQLKK
jgi:hypothetical protein